MSLGGVGRSGFALVLSASSADAAKVAYLRAVGEFSILYRDSEIDKVRFEIICVLGNVMSPMVLLVSASSRLKVLGLP